jgi:hypothetical protein
MRGTQMATIQKRNDRDKPWRVRWREGAIHRSRSFRLKSEAKAFDVEAERIEAEQRAGTWDAPPEALNDHGGPPRCPETMLDWSKTICCIPPMSHRFNHLLVGEHGPVVRGQLM